MKISTIFFLAVIAVIIKKMMGNSNLDVFVEWIKKWEGAYGRSKSDPASRYLPPGSDIHTVKGITWQTFSSNSKQLGYPCTLEHFLKMPNATWWIITKRKFWDVWEGIDTLHKLKPGIAYFIADYGFNRGTGGTESDLANYQRKYMNIKDSNISKKEIVHNFLVDPMPWRQRMRHCAEYKTSVYMTFSGWSLYGKGWTNRLNDLLEKFGK